nr:MAG TPA: hypothetical protein [Caudoviricetes sp.]
MAKCVMLKNGGVTDVVVGGKSVVADGTATIDYADTSIAGVMKIEPAYGTTRLGNDRVGYQLGIEGATESDIAGRKFKYKPITSAAIDFAVKAAMTDGKGDAWTDAELQAELARMGCTVGDDGTVKFTV